MAKLDSRLMGVPGWLANALNCNASGRGFDSWTRQGERPCFVVVVVCFFSGVHPLADTCAHSSAPVSLS